MNIYWDHSEIERICAYWLDDAFVCDRDIFHFRNNITIELENARQQATSSHRKHFTWIVSAVRGPSPSSTSFEIEMLNGRFEAPVKKYRTTCRQTWADKEIIKQINWIYPETAVSLRGRAQSWSESTNESYFFESRSCCYCVLFSACNPRLGFFIYCVCFLMLL